MHRTVCVIHENGLIVRDCIDALEPRDGLVRHIDVEVVAGMTDRRIKRRGVLI